MATSNAKWEEFKQKNDWRGFITANKELMECFEKVDAEKAKKMSAAERSKLCSTHSDKIKDYLKRDALTMPKVLGIRLKALKFIYPESQKEGVTAKDMTVWTQYEK